MMRSEPNIHRRCSLDPLTLKKLTGPFEIHQSSSHGQSQSLSRLPLHSNSPNPSHLHTSPHGSNSHLSNHGSNSSLNDQLFPTFTPPDDPMEQQGRSKSLGNIFSSLSSQQQHSPPLQSQQAQAVQGQTSTTLAGGVATTTSSGGSVGGAGGGSAAAQKRRSPYGFNNIPRGAIKRPRYICLYTCIYILYMHTQQCFIAESTPHTNI